MNTPLSPKSATQQIIRSTARFRAIREELALLNKLETFIQREGCEDCNELEAYPGARFCESCSQDRLERREAGIPNHRFIPRRVA